MRWKTSPWFREVHCSGNLRKKGPPEDPSQGTVGLAGHN